MNLSRLARFVVTRVRWVTLAWVVVVVALTTLVPTLEEVVSRDSTPFVPSSAPSIRSEQQMDDTFGNGKSSSYIVVVVERDGGLSDADRAYVDSLQDRLRRDTEHVTYVQDLGDEKELRDALTSRDGEALYFQVGLPGETGAPTSNAQVDAVRDATDHDRPAGLDVAVTGASATITDMVNVVEHNILRITIVTVVLIAIILFVIYRSWSITAFVLSIIGLSLLAARGSVALLGLHTFSVSTFTGSFLTGVVLGATTDYAIFLVSRYHEHRRAGLEPREAATAASSKVSAVIIGSAFTVMLANACMLLADVGLFRTTGPAMAVGVGAALAISVTLTPALLGMLGSRGYLEQKRFPRDEHGWQRTADRVVNRPVRALTVGLIPLILLAAFAPALRPSFDERSTQPDDTESNLGYRLMAAHFPTNEATPDYLLVRADHDLRTPENLAALEQASAAVARTPGVVSVRGVTRPLGTTITEASLGKQAGLVGDRLAEANDELAGGTDGAQALADGAGRLASGAGSAATGATQLLDGIDDLHAGVERLAAGSDDAVGGSAKLRSGAQALASGLDSAISQTQVAVDGLGLAYTALTRSLTCRLDLYCKRARDGIRQIYEAERDRLIPGLREAAAGAHQLADGSADLDSGLRRIRDGLHSADAGTTRLAAGQRDLTGGLQDLADGSGQVKGGTEKVASSLGELQSGLDEAARFLQQTGEATQGTSMGGFYLPPSALKDSRFLLSSGAFISADGRTARLIVLGDSDAFGRAAAHRVGEVVDAMHTGLRGTSLEDADVSATGMAPTNADIEKLSAQDLRLVAAVALLAVFLVLLLLLRSLVAATFLLASVALSYAAAIGLSVLTWQLLFDQPIEWTVPCIAFVLLVAVGADYNLLLMKRVQEEAPDGSREGIARAVALTGGVITSAGVIFAASMFAFMSASVITIVQLGFAVGTGLLLDTFVVRTFVVPAVAALLGPRLWWPRHPTGAY